MENIGWIQLASIFLGIIALIFSIRNLVLRKKVNNNLEKKILESKIEMSIEKLINKRNANTKGQKRRTLSEKEIDNLIKKFESLTKQLEEAQKKHFEDSWSIKNQKDKINYLTKLIDESNDSKEFKRFQKAD